MTGRKWVRRSLRHLRRNLRKQGHRACPNTVGRLLRKQDFPLKSNRKGPNGKAPPDRDLQFQHIQPQREAYTAAGLPGVRSRNTITLPKHEHALTGGPGGCGAQGGATWWAQAGRSGGDWLDCRA